MNNVYKTQEYIFHFKLRLLINLISRKFVLYFGQIVQTCKVIFDVQVKLNAFLLLILSNILSSIM